MFEMFLKLFLGFAQDYRRVRFRCHWAEFAKTSEKALFLTVTNLSRSREIEVTHVWVETEPQVHALQPSRPLPKRLRPDEAWETWIPLSELTNQGRPWLVAMYGMQTPLRQARLRLSTGRTVKSLPDKGVPGAGSVAGG